MFDGGTLGDEFDPPDLGSIRAERRAERSMSADISIPAVTERANQRAYSGNHFGRIGRSDWLRPLQHVPGNGFSARSKWSA